MRRKRTDAKSANWVPNGVLQFPLKAVYKVLSLFLVSVFTFLGSFIHSEEAKQISFEEFAKIPNGQAVIIRGFLHRTNDQKWILAPKPNLKSCCIGSRHNSHEQVMLNGQFDVSWVNRAIDVSGKWSISPDHAYELDEASFIPPTPARTWVIILALLFVAALAIGAILRRKRIASMGNSRMD